MDIYILLDIVCSRISATTNIWVFLLGTFCIFLKKNSFGIGSFLKRDDRVL